MHGGIETWIQDGLYAKGFQYIRFILVLAISFETLRTIIVHGENNKWCKLCSWALTFLVASKRGHQNWHKRPHQESALHNHLDVPVVPRGAFVLQFVWASLGSKPRKLWGFSWWVGEPGTLGKKIEFQSPSKKTLKTSPRRSFSTVFDQIGPGSAFGSPDIVFCEVFCFIASRLLDSAVQTT